MFLLKAVGENLFLCLSQLLGTVCPRWLMVSSLHPQSQQNGLFISLLLTSASVVTFPPVPMSHSLTLTLLSSSYTDPSDNMRSTWIIQVIPLSQDSQLNHTDKVSFAMSVNISTGFQIRTRASFCTHQLHTKALRVFLNSIVQRVKRQNQK